MPRTAYLADCIKQNELKEKYLTSLDSVESRKWHLLWKVSLWWTIKDSNRAVSIDYQYVKKNLKKHNELRTERIKNQRKKRQHQRGKKPLLNQSQLEKLIKQLKTIPLDGVIWTELNVARWIAKETGIEKKIAITEIEII